VWYGAQKNGSESHSIKASLTAFFTAADFLIFSPRSGPRSARRQRAPPAFAHGLIVLCLCPLRAATRHDAGFQFFRPERIELCQFESS
jgi:hypothetical protein